MRFERYEYDVESNQFKSRPVIAIVTTIRDDVFLRELFAARARLLDAWVELMLKRVDELAERIKRMGEE